MRLCCSLVFSLLCPLFIDFFPISFYVYLFIFLIPSSISNSSFFFVYLVLPPPPASTIFNSPFFSSFTQLLFFHLPHRVRRHERDILKPIFLSAFTYFPLPQKAPTEAIRVAPGGIDEVFPRRAEREPRARTPRGPKKAGATKGQTDGPNRAEVYASPPPGGIPALSARLRATSLVRTQRNFP